MLLALCAALRGMTRSPATPFQPSRDVNHRFAQCIGLTASDHAGTESLNSFTRNGRLSAGQEDNSRVLSPVTFIIVSCDNGSIVSLSLCLICKLNLIIGMSI